MLELAGSLYSSYFNADNELKTEIIKMLMLELTINNKKELKIEDSPLLKSSKMLKNSFGTYESFNYKEYFKELAKVDLDELKEFYEFIKI